MKLFTSLLLASLFLFPSLTHALDISGSVPFGGYVTSFFPCLCRPFGMNIQYKPLFVASAIPLSGELYYKPRTRLYAWFAPFGPVIPGTPGTWNLGKFTPDGGQCVQPDPTIAAENAAAIAAGNPELVRDPCDPGIPVPAMGTIDYMGTSLPSIRSISL